LQLEAQSGDELGSDDLQKKFRLESSNDIDTELAAMKAQLLSGSKSQPSCRIIPQPVKDPPDARVGERVRVLFADPLVNAETATSNRAE